MPFRQASPKGNGFRVTLSIQPTPKHPLIMDIKDISNYMQDHPEAITEGQERLQAVLARSATDWEFRQKLLTDPRAALSEFSGRQVREDLNVVFIENHADATIVLPDPQDQSVELSEEELEAVAGGVDIVSWLTFSAATLAVYDAWFD